MKMDATFMGFGLLVLAMGCGNTPPESAAPPASQVQASPARDMPSAQELAATRTSAAVTAVPVRYVVDPATTTQLSVSAGTEKASPSSTSEPLAPGAVRRSSK
ncbi:hypothetical protein [Pyxidicoccus xibeiensis]|uniref:hypothetical protein n=1 Tax=Pyxidicoccus xibeiensis TaxID=2906759 RepID=UPI0020A7A6F9|nr:hypothetical protein [Pyxidicoccus xibeiensis]MCP3139389.1 hypothetical protein [Pyxidicoccus xibeiensis]